MTLMARLARFSIFISLGVLLVFSTVVASASCGTMASDSREHINSSVVSLSVELKGGGTEQGSGVIVSSSGYIITNYHVIKDQRTITVNTYRGENTRPTARYRATVIRSNENLDIAVIKITQTSSGGDVSASTLRSALTPISFYGSAELDDSIRVIGYPLIGGGTISTTRGDLTGSNSVPVGGSRATVWLTDATFASGGSGGLVISCSGVMIGIPGKTRPDGGTQLTVIFPMDTICSIDSDICDDYIGAQWIEDSGAGGGGGGGGTGGGTSTCGGLSARLTVGGRGRVKLYPNLPNRVRESPGTDGRVLGPMDTGVVFQVLDGPVCENNINWWRVRSSDMEGWTAEGKDGEYFVEPY
jgi:hypothetical protein